MTATHTRSGAPRMSDDEQFINALYWVIQRHYRSPAFSIPRLAAELEISERQLQRRVRSATGRSPVQCLQDYRLDRAREHLRLGLTVGETAKAVGFSSHTYFTHCFKARFGTTPQELRPGKP